MSETEYVCQNCGSGRIYAVIEARGTEDGVVVKGRGGLRFEGDGRPDYHDHDEVEYGCEDCGRTMFKLEELVEPRVAAEQNALPCGRCDHLSTDHEALSDVFDPKRFIRPQRPCHAEGCDCHDYYDPAVAFADPDKVAQLAITDLIVAPTESTR